MFYSDRPTARVVGFNAVKNFIKLKTYTWKSVLRPGIEPLISGQRSTLEPTEDFFDLINVYWM